MGKNGDDGHRWQQPPQSFFRPKMLMRRKTRQTDAPQGDSWLPNAGYCQVSTSYSGHSWLNLGVFQVES